MVNEYWIIVSAIFAAFLLFIVTRRPAQQWRPVNVPTKSADFRAVNITEKRKKAPVTGKSYMVIGTGSLGDSIIDYLLERGEKKVKGYDVVPNSRFANDPRITFIKGSVENLESLKAALVGVDVVFHTAAVIRITTYKFDVEISERVNVVGTKNIIAACKACGVKALIYTSTSNVVISREFRGNGVYNGDETMPYAKEPMNIYVRTKIQGEKAVLAANDVNGLRTVAIRPASGIFGPHDGMFVENVLKVRDVPMIAPYTSDFVFVENVAWGHLLAEKGLFENPARVSGQAFFVSNNEPMSAHDFSALIKFYEPRVVISSYPYPLYYLLALISSSIQTMFGRVKWLGPLAMLDLSLLELMSINYTFSSGKASNLLGYSPLYTVSEAVQKTVFDFNEYLKKKK